MASSVPPAARREILLGPAALWSLLSVSWPVEVGEKAGSLWEPRALMHCKEGASC